MHTTQNKVYRAGSIKLTEKELQDATDKGCVAIIGYKTAWAIATTCSGFQITKAYHTRASVPLMSRGRFCMLDAKDANKLIGYEIFASC